MPQLRDPLDTPKKNRIRGGIMASEWAQEESGIISTDQDIAAVFDCHPETVAYVRYDDEDCCNPAERAGEAKNFVRYDMPTVTERFLAARDREERARKSRTSKKRQRASSTGSGSEFEDEFECEESQEKGQEVQQQQSKEKKRRITMRPTIRRKNAATAVAVAAT
ncbi:hypothetical protein B0T09DRAFT_66561 [Sordaria sp. MPI-SDFR-AT-0083]|nr:hypothetical protein B0T09DRAFT_66561 [Sordaria sp. MPI-SDFR-AT-0083]